MKFTHYNLQKNRRNHAKNRNFLNNKYLALCGFKIRVFILSFIFVALCGFEKFRPRNTQTMYKLLYNCRESSTNSHLFMQNKANFKNLPMSATTFTKTTYEDFCCFLQPKNKANSKPNKANFKNDKN